MRSVSSKSARLKTGFRRELVTVAGALADEWDQTNAYYVTRFIMGPGLQFFRQHVLNDRTLQSLRSIKNRWPQNPYLVQSAARFAMKLKRHALYPARRLSDPLDWRKL